MQEFATEFRLPFAVALLGLALIFCVVAYLHATPQIATCAGICGVSAARIIYAVARDAADLRPGHGAW